MLRLDSEVQYVKGVGPRRSALLGSRGIRTVEDLLLHIPKAYQDRSVFVPLNALSVGQDAAVHGKVYGSRTIHTRSRGKILDNLRRSLVPTAMLALLVMGWLVLPQPLAWTLWVLATLFVTFALMDSNQYQTDVYWQHTDHQPSSEVDKAFPNMNPY